jgi:hypothetical protein
VVIEEVSFALLDSLFREFVDFFGNAQTGDAHALSARITHRMAVTRYPQGYERADRADWFADLSFVDKIGVASGHPFEAGIVRGRSEVGRLADLLGEKGEGLFSFLLVGPLGDEQGDNRDVLSIRGREFVRDHVLANPPVDTYRTGQAGPGNETFVPTTMLGDCA